MKKLAVISCLALTLVLTVQTFANELPSRTLGHDSVYHGGNSDLAKSSRDSVFLLGPWGSGAQHNGQFEDQGGSPAWNDWTHWDGTTVTEHHWQVSDYAAANLNNIPSNLAAFCGDLTYASCDPQDPIGGYGNDYNDILEYSYVVYDGTMGCTITVDGVFNSNTEPGYDYTIFRFETADGFVESSVNDGIHTAEMFSYSHTYSPADYVGQDQDEVRFQIAVTSDGGYSDEDCHYWGNGACQIDDITIHCSNGNASEYVDFQDGTFGPFVPVLPIGVGDFAGLWMGLEDLDPCVSNYSPQVAFIDSGDQVPGVGPSYCQNWCYGPGGYIVNTTGGADPDGHLWNYIQSPVLTWPGQQYTGGHLVFGVYSHEDLSADAPGIFYSWAVRSTNDELGSPIDSAPWVDRTFVYYGGPDYRRTDSIVSDILVPGVTQVQVKLECREIGPNWGFIGDDGYPAPYFDNVSFKAFQNTGPSMSAREIDIAQDNFSASGLEVDLSNLASNNVRFDSASNKAIFHEEHNIPGDSILCRVVSSRAGGELVSNRLVYTMQRNPVFDSVRDPNWGVSGSSDGIAESSGAKFSYDLPDSGFLFPGDVLHYYFEATDEVAHADPQTSTVPADISEFGNFSEPLAYASGFQVHALPSVGATGRQPNILFWNDFGNRGGEDEWYTGLMRHGLDMGYHFDVFYTNGPSSGVGNGLGGRAVYEQIQNYDKLLYTCGNLGSYTISNGDHYFDPGQDIQLLTEWLASGDTRDAFFCGDDLASDLNSGGELSMDFVSDKMNVQVFDSDIRPMIYNQVAPLVLPEPGNSVFFTSPGWVAYGGCMSINTFDAVEAGPGAERLAGFTNPSGMPDFSFSAATLNMPGDDRIITMPYDFMYVFSDPNHPVGNGLSARDNLMREVLDFFQIPNSGGIEDVLPGAEKFSATNHPNPFNPSTRIEFNMPQAGHLKLKIYNVRGELVNTLIDETRAAGADYIMWDGTNAQGASVSSGVYFYEARAGGEVQISKMALVK